MRAWLRPPCFWLAGCVMALACGVARAQDWPQWRGPAGTGVASDAKLPGKWSRDQNVAWKAPLPGPGNSSPVAWGDRVFITQSTQKDHRRTVMCFKRADGKLLWQAGVTDAKPEPTNGQNPYCSASPVTDGQRVIAFFGSPGLYCYDMDGRELWRRELGAVDSWHGSGSSPIIWQDLCFLNFGPGTNSAIVACDKRTGGVVWKVKLPRTGFAFGLPGLGGGGEHGSFDNAAMDGDMSGRGGFQGSWSTPVIIHDAAGDQLVIVEPTRVVAYEPKTGTEIWACKGLPEQVFCSPAVAEGVLVASGHMMNGGTQAIAVRLGGKGDVTATHRLWQIRLPKDCVGSPVISEGRVYFVTSFGSVVCLEFKSGKKLAEKRLIGAGSRGGSWSSIVLADGKLLVTDQSGEVFVLEATPRLQLLETNSVGDQTTASSPALCGGQVFLRTYDALWCFGAGKAK